MRIMKWMMSLALFFQAVGAHGEPPEIKVSGGPLAKKMAEMIRAHNRGDYAPCRALTGNKPITTRNYDVMGSTDICRRDQQSFASVVEIRELKLPANTVMLRWHDARTRHSQALPTPSPEARL